MHELKLPETLENSVKFINAGGIMAVTGDFGNWIFCREFHPSVQGYVSDDYWCEKLQIASRQNSYFFDTDKTRATLKEKLQEFEDNDELDFEIEEYIHTCINYADDEIEYTYYANWNIPSDFDRDFVVFEKSISNWLLTIFDAFEEICSRLDNPEIE